MSFEAIIDSALADPKATGRAHRIGSLDRYEALVAAAAADYDGYWKALAAKALTWRKSFSQGLDASHAPVARWFADGEISVSENCLDIHPAGKTALIFESDSGQVERVTYGEMLRRVCQLAGALEARGVVAGDRVMIYMPMCPDAIVAMHACARIGATHVVVFGGFAAEAIRGRANDVGAVAIITADIQRRGGKSIALKAAVDEALADGACPSVRSVIVARRGDAPCPMQPGRDLWWDKAILGQPDFIAPRAFPSEHPLFILHTSGSTGKPKGVVHSSGGYLLHAKLTSMWTFDLRSDDVFWCTADVGWITGHTYCAYGPMSCGATQVIFEGVPTFPDASRFWRMIESHKVSVFYTAPTAIRALIKASAMDPDMAPGNFDLTSLRLLGTVGEPISPQAWQWYSDHVGGGRCPVLDTFWQTETGGHVITPLPGVGQTSPGSCSLPFPGIDVAIVSPDGVELPWGEQGLLVIRKPWPSMIRNVWGNHARFEKSYFPKELGGLYLAGDGARRDEGSGHFRIMGRVDDVLNVSGHRLGTAEIEAALGSHPEVAESAVVAQRDELTGEAVCAFIVAKGARPEGGAALELSASAKAWVAQQISPIAKPARIVFVDAVPKTRSGKIMRRILKAIANKDQLEQDISTLDDPAAVAGVMRLVNPDS